ncbi:MULTISPECIES: hypothetical protein [unclassified Pseudomonas]|uniref:hypothetical protein n=1 Tax=unclassified Pseudomonas TaxID=196821 RepID=UPI00128D512C|nr:MULTISPECIES: hypothetical protein [unclassified Pseudomonas]MPQ68301.1 hypothetical protein [Pseudomonas sp. MWU12-2323]
MSVDSTNRVRLAVGASVGFVVALALALGLLLFSKFSGAEFTAFVLAFALLAVAVGFAPEVQEISIAGSVVKLREIKAEALSAIESLNTSRVEMFSVFLGLALKHSGGFGNSGPIDPRVAEFWELTELIKKYNCVQELKAPLATSLYVLMVAQLRCVAWRNDKVGDIFAVPLIEPIRLAAIAFDPEGIAGAENRTSPKPENYREEIVAAIEEYRKLFEFKKVVDEFK